MSSVVTMRTLAERSGVSISVVSAVINGSRSVRMSDETRARVERAIRESGYVPNMAAKSLRRSQSDAVAFVLPHLDDPVYADLVRGVYERADARGLLVLLADTALVESGSGAIDRILAQGQVDGLLVRPSAEIDHEQFRGIADRGAPLVVLDELDDPAVHWIGIDDRAGIALATQHLIDTGHTEIGLLGGNPGYAGTARRIAAYESTLAAAGLAPPHPPALVKRQSGDEGYRVMSELISSGSLPSALVVNTVSTALGVVAAAIDRGIEIPDDLSLIAYLDASAVEYQRPPLTTVRMPMREIGRAAVDAFLTLRDGGTWESGVWSGTAPQLIRRGTVR